VSGGVFRHEKRNQQRNVLATLPQWGALDWKDTDTIVKISTEPARIGITYRSEVELEFEDVASVKGLGPAQTGALAPLSGSEIRL
jgi:hypothetical protein